MSGRSARVVVWSVSAFVVLCVCLVASAQTLATGSSVVDFPSLARKSGEEIKALLVSGTIGALYPALRAARQDAVAALSYE